MYALAQITEMIKVSIDSRKFGCGIFVKLRKAFDTVNHEILVNKLEHYAIRDSMLNWFQSHLFNRKQFVSFNCESSELLVNNCGVPEGSVLDPLLFLINISKTLTFYLFADDTNIYYVSNSLIGQCQVKKPVLGQNISRGCYFMKTGLIFLRLNAKFSISVPKHLRKMRFTMI